MKETAAWLVTVSCFIGGFSGGEELEMSYFRRACSTLGGLAAIPTG
jgi:hypothetical protein